MENFISAGVGSGDSIGNGSPRYLGRNTELPNAYLEGNSHDS
jgi:hypothetical protein